MEGCLPQHHRPENIQRYNYYFPYLIGFSFKCNIFLQKWTHWPRPCQICGFQLQNLEERRSHWQSLHQRRSQACFWCYRKYTSKFRTEKHLFTFHRLRGASCLHCNEELPGMLHLHRHVSYAHPEEPPTCPFCSRRFAAKSSLVRHLYTCKEKKRTDFPHPAPVKLEPEDRVQDEAEDREVGKGSHAQSGSIPTTPAPGCETEA